MTPASLRNQGDVAMLKESTSYFPKQAQLPPRLTPTTLWTAALSLRRIAGP